MSTAQEYLDGIDGLEKESFIMGASKLAFKGLGIGKKIGKFTIKPPKPPTPSFGTQVGNTLGSAKKWAGRQHSDYLKTDIGKKFGDTPLKVAGGVAAGSILL